MTAAIFSERTQLGILSIAVNFLPLWILIDDRRRSHILEAVVLAIGVMICVSATLLLNRTVSQARLLTPKAKSMFNATRKLLVKFSVLGLSFFLFDMLIFVFDLAGWLSSTLIFAMLAVAGSVCYLLVQRNPRAWITRDTKDASLGVLLGFGALAAFMIIANS